MSFRPMFGFPYNICAKGIKVRSEDPKHSRKHDNDLRLLRGITKFAHYVVLHKVMYLQRTLVFFFFWKNCPTTEKVPNLIPTYRKKFPYWPVTCLRWAICVLKINIITRQLAGQLNKCFSDGPTKNDGLSDLLLCV